MNHGPSSYGVRELGADLKTSPIVVDINGVPRTNAAVRGVQRMDPNARLGAVEQSWVAPEVRVEKNVVRWTEQCERIARVELRRSGSRFGKWCMSG